MTERDQKTIRWASIGDRVYLAAFGGFKLWKSGGAGRDDYQTLVKKAEQLQAEVREQENKALLFEKLSDEYKFDPRKIKKETLVADASAAIQSAAQQGGIQLGPFRESPARSSGRDLTTIQVEGSGQVSSGARIAASLADAWLSVADRFGSVQSRARPTRAGESERDHHDFELRPVQGRAECLSDTIRFCGLSAWRSRG